MASEPDFDVIVIGAGVAGCVTAYRLAEMGCSVALIERGEAPGSKNLSGGVLYCRAMTGVFPRFLDDAPIERRIDRNKIYFMNEDSWVGMDYADQRLYDAGTAVTVLRAHLDAWLADQAEAAGVALMCGVKVDALLVEDAQVVGVRAGEDELRCRVVVAADGVNSFIARDAGLRPKPALSQQAVGIKALIGMDSSTIEERFGVAADHGVAYALVGDCSQGVGGGGFLYTNKQSLSVGLVLRLDDLVASGMRSVDIFDHMMAHPLVDSLVRGGDLIEYGCHLVNEGGHAMMGQIVHNGLVLVGDAAGLTLNTGLTVRGMDLATGSGIAAAEGISQALAADDVTATGLAAYQKALDASFVGQDMRTYAKAPRFLENGRLYTAYGPLLADVMRSVFALDTTPRRRLLPTARAALKASDVRVTQVIADAWEGVRAL
ncbi:MAG: FAD-dependent oxidoreductase [Propionibacteriaceae bacterium]|nr:FAD-dependent oxidoreductase [Propionibacteriaceae bacterium]